MSDWLFSGKLVKVLEGEHSLVAGTEIDSARRSETRVNLQNGQALLADFGDNLQARTQRGNLFASLVGGLRLLEGRRRRQPALPTAGRPRSSGP